METLRFSYNWNNKLNCRVFTTFRIYNDKKYYKGARLKVFLNGQYVKDVEVLDIKILRLSDINDWIAYIDTGYSKDEFIRIVNLMYENVPNINNLRFCLLLLCTIDGRSGRGTGDCE